ncbi:MAG TPA: response regulator [Rhodospirillaceae bacterium]|nr:response regulator [Rhodospirillaceae bacterium]
MKRHPKGPDPRGEGEPEILRVNRALATLTHATEALIRSTDEQQLLNEICRIVVEVGGYAFAWVGYLQHDEERSIWPVAQFRDDEYLIHARTSWGEGENGQGPAGMAIRTGLPQVFQFAGQAEAASPWRKAAARRGFQAHLALPLRVEGRIIGVINLYSTDAAAFDDEELPLMANLAHNLAYGIGMQRIQFERRRAERELKESEGRYRSLVELSPDAIVVHTQEIIIFSNSAADRLFRATAELPLLGKRMQDLAHPEDSPHFSRPAAAPPGGVVEERLARLDGSFFVAEVSEAPVIFHGVHARQVVIRDVTERKHVQEQLIQAAKLATLGEMAAGMAHELSQPINIIRMAAEGTLLMIDRKKAPPEYQVKQFALIADQAGRMSEIIDHIRIFSRKDAGAVSVFDAFHSVRLATEMMGPQLLSNGIEICLDLPSQACPVRGRPVQMEQVILNLLSNAQDAVLAARLDPAKPNINRIDVLGVIIDDAFARFTVSDSGIGIPANQLDRVFEPFFTTKEIGRGTGLGLSVSFGIISAMGGRLEAHNRPGGGAQFVLVLPLVTERLSRMPASALDRPGRTSLPAGSKGRHILLVDDEPEALRTMGAYLDELGYRVSRAESGNAAFDLYRADPADLVVTDIRMPDGDGEDLVRRLRNQAPALPIIVVTGHIGMTEKLEADAAKRIAILKKPISLSLMADTLEQLLQRH